MHSYKSNIRVVLLNRTNHFSTLHPQKKNIRIKKLHTYSLHTITTMWLSLQLLALQNSRAAQHPSQLIEGGKAKKTPKKLALMSWWEIFMRILVTSPEDHQGRAALIFFPSTLALNLLPPAAAAWSGCFTAWPCSRSWKRARRSSSSSPVALCFWTKTYSLYPDTHTWPRPVCYT